MASIAARSFRSLSELRIEPASTITTVVGPNAAGKTNLLEALYFALTGRSFRTGDRREMIAFGHALARSEAELHDEQGGAYTLLGSVSRSEGRRHLLDGEAADPATIARHRPHVAVFSPDRLALVKGPPGERRAHLDGFIASRWPARSDLRRVYGQALAQRNALLGRVAAGLAPAAELDAWDGTLAARAAALTAARAEATSELAEPFSTAAAELGLGEPAELRYRPRSDSDPEAVRAGLAERRESDLERGRTGWGPHLDELELSLEERSLRRYGSQGQQRAGLLALLFAEHAALLETAGAPPLMLLDDVMSELDPEHRELLAERLDGAGQSLITAADESDLPRPARGHVVRMPAAAGPLAAVA
ncbi:MAG: DNA replication and repair protein RecF [Actinomycetota bacterium]